MSPQVTDLVLASGAVIVIAVRAAAAGAEARQRAAGWPLWRCGPAVALLVLHDVLVGAVAIAAYGFTARALASRFATGDAAGIAGTALAVVAALGSSATLLHRRRGIAVRGLLLPRGTVVEPCPTLRAGLLDGVERAALRATSHWITAGLERCQHRCGATPEQLLPALWPAVRLRLREAPGVPRTEVALLLLSAQAVMDDASPATERMLTLLHLVHARAGWRGLRGALEEARRSPMRHGRPGPAAWSVTSHPISS